MTTEEHTAPGTSSPIRDRTMLAGCQSDCTPSFTLLVGRRDDPIDGVRDYCRELARTCTSFGAQVDVIEVPWASEGWGRALISLWRRLRTDRPRAVIVQVTHLAWSRRGFSPGMIFPIVVAWGAGIRAGAMIHDPLGFGGGRLVDRLRRGVQCASMRLLTRLADPVFVSVEPSLIPWLGGCRDKAFRLVVGSNVGENPNGVRRERQGHPFGVTVFGVTEGLRGAHEREVIVEVARRAAVAIGPVRIVAFGRGTGPEDGQWPDAPDISVESHGLVSAVEAANLLSEANLLLHIRGPISSCRGTVAAAIAHALPIVGYRGTETGPPVTEAGVVTVEPGDLDALASALVRIREDCEFAFHLREKTVGAWRDYFSWEAIARAFLRGVRCVQ